MKHGDIYHKWVEWSAEDGVYIGRCPDVITGVHGDDPAEVYRDLIEVVEDVLESLTASGGQVPAPRTRPMMEVA